MRAFSELMSTLKGFTAPVWFIFLGTFLNRFGTFVVPFLALHMGRLGYSARESGLAIAFYGAGHLVASIVGGHLADTIGRRNTIALSMFSGALSMVMLSQAESLWSIVALAGLAGLTSEIYKPASSALLIDLTPEHRRVTAFAVYRFAINAGWAIGPATAGLLAKHSYQWLFFGDAATSIVFGFIALKALPQLRAGERGDLLQIRSAILNVREAVQSAMQNARFRRFLLATLIAAVVFIQVPTTFGLEVKAAGYGEEVYGILLALNGILIVLFEIPISGFVQRMDTRRVIASGFVFMGIGIGSLAWANTTFGYAMALSIFTFGEMVSMPVAMAYVSQVAPPNMRGRFMGVYGLTWGAAFTFGPASGMAIFSFSPEILWSMCGLLGIVAGGIILGSHRVSQGAQVVQESGGSI